MDAKVLRAAVSAAIRVTISTTLIGCGGSVVGDADGLDSTPKGTAGRGHGDGPTSSGGHAAAPAPAAARPTAQRQPPPPAQA